ncbi:MAG TPA: sigma-70 family RNA polymerase sigma factor [Blastocatellia bacterium]|nr:sigma-70 family RNA polymerase sigma factor [Blastocatellia bacterium]
MSTPTPEVTRLLVAWREGNQSALDELLPMVYDELRRIARRYLSRESPGHTLQATALVNEAYLRLVNQQNLDWQNRAHFFAVAARVMRHLLVDHARSYQYAKRGGGAVQVTLNEALDVSAQSNEIADVLALDEALEKLAKVDPRKCQLIELRFFGGLSIEETATVLNISEITVKREWAKAKAWLFRELRGQ